MDDPSPLPDTTLAALPGVSVPSVSSSPSRLSRSHPDDSEESLSSAAGGGGRRSSDDCSYDSSVMGGGGGGCDGGGGGGFALGGCGACGFFRTAPSKAKGAAAADAAADAVPADAAADVLCLRVEPCESVGDERLGGEDVFGGSGGGGGDTDVTVVSGGEDAELDVGEVLVVGGENCIVGGLAYREGGTAYGGEVSGVDIGGEGVVDMGDLAAAAAAAEGEGVVLVTGGGESPGDECDLGGDGAEGLMGCGRSGVAVGVILVIMSSPLPLPLRLPSPMSPRRPGPAPPP